MDVKYSFSGSTSILSKAAHLVKAFSPIERTFLPIEMLLIVDSREKAFSAIAVTG